MYFVTDGKDLSEAEHWKKKKLGEAEGNKKSFIWETAVGRLPDIFSKEGEATFY